MARYSKDNYTLEDALYNIGESFWISYHKELLLFAKDSNRQDILKKIHDEWDQRLGLSPVGTDIRIEWAVAIYNHGDWESALKTKVPEYKAPAPNAIADPRKKYPAEFRCDNGVYVRSLSELFIANWFYYNKISFEYEREVFFASCHQYAHCDYYLPQYNVYIEFWGMEKDEQYLAYKQWKEPLYERNGYKLISLNYQDLKLFQDNISKRVLKHTGLQLVCNK